MKPEQWQNVKDKLESLFAVDASQRPAYLDQIAANDGELRRELESLLLSHEGMADDFLSIPVYSRQEDYLPAPTMIGRRLGPYQIVAEIGRGGMGEVYRALRVDDQYQKEVAIKLIRAGRESEFVIARFKNERQILAKLDHPNIAGLLDGGTTPEGVPYFVMELIEGESIVEYCRQRVPDISARLGLFLQVCSAVQFAHQRLIIHRDIKPGNILVTVGGIPKLLDFGISKILGGESETGPAQRTATVLHMLTPAYASPEQIKGESVTTASDVYSLGMVLYELLTGRHPYPTDSTPDQIVRAICEFEPEKPSTAVKEGRKRAKSDLRGSVDTAKEKTEEKLNKRLRGDLDNVVLMALRKEPQRRYSSVEQFAEDIRRYLGNLPVIARKDTTGYRASKFIARHKSAVASASATVLVLLAALITTTHEMRIARQQAAIAQLERARAQHRFDDVRKLANSLMFEIHDSIMNLPGATQARQLLVKRALEYLDRLSRESSDPALQRELAAAYERIGDVQGYNGMANLDDFSGASASYAKALAILEPLSAASPNDVHLRAELLRGYFEASAAFENAGDFDSVLRTLHKAQILLSSLPGGESDRQRQFSLSGIHYYTGRALEKTGHFPEALESYRKAASLMEVIASAPQANVLSRAYLSGDYIGLSKTQADVGHLSEAVATGRKAIDMVRTLSKGDLTNATLRETLANEYDDFSDVLVASGDLQRALWFAGKVRQIEQQLVASDPRNRMAEVDLAWGDLQVAEILTRKHRAREAKPMITAAMSIFQKTNPANKYWYAVEMGETYLDFGRVSASLAESAGSPAEEKRLLSEARSWYQRALDVRSSGPGQLDSNGHDQIGEIRRELARASAGLARLQTPPQPTAH